MSKQRQLVLNCFYMRFGHHPAAWRHPASRGTGRPEIEFWINAAKLAEEGKFDTFFVADFIGRGNDVADSMRQSINYQFEPLSLLSAIARETRHIGLVATVNTNFSDPYNVARQFTSLDHLSGGRAGWNVVSSFNPVTARNFGISQPRSHDERYARAAEFLDITKGLWDSWDDDAFDHVDRGSGEFFDARSAHPINYQGQYYASEGLLDLPRPIQGYPVLVQAGNSETGIEFAARVAEMTYCSAQSLDIAKAYYADVKGRMAKYGRAEDQLKVTPGLSVVVAETDQEAQDTFNGLQEAVDFTTVNLMGYDLTGYPLDGPLPDLPEKENGKGRAKQLIALARKEKLSIRDLVLRFNVSRGHVQVVGSVKTVADFIEKWFVERGADGFNVVPPLLPQGFEDFIRLVVPELQRRGIYRKEYKGKTYRENLGLDRPANPNTN